jgi:hypothetical protein
MTIKNKKEKEILLKLLANACKYAEYELDDDLFCKKISCLIHDLMGSLELKSYGATDGENDGDISISLKSEAEIYGYYNIDHLTGEE